MQAHQERHENMRLRAQNEILKADNQRYRDAIQNASCPQCAGKTAVGEMCFEEHQLRIENAELKEEVLAKCELYIYIYMYFFLYKRNYILYLLT